MARQSTYQAIVKAIQEYYTQFIRGDDVYIRTMKTSIGGDPTKTVIRKDFYGWDIDVYIDTYQEQTILKRWENGVFKETDTEWQFQGEKRIVSAEIHERRNPRIINVPMLHTFDCTIKIKPIERPNFWTLRGVSKVPVKIAGSDVACICDQVLEAVEKLYPRMKGMFLYSNDLREVELKHVNLYTYTSFNDVDDWVYPREIHMYNGEDRLIDLTQALAYTSECPDNVAKQKVAYYGQSPERIKMFDERINRMDFERMKTLFFEHKVVSKSILQAYGGYFLSQFLKNGDGGMHYTENGVNAILNRSFSGGYDTCINYIKMRYRYYRITQAKPEYSLLPFGMNMYHYGTLLFLNQTGAFCQIRTKKGSRNMGTIYWIMQPEEIQETINNLKRKDMDEWLEI